MIQNFSECRCAGNGTRKLGFRWNSQSFPSPCVGRMFRLQISSSMASVQQVVEILQPGPLHVR